MSNYVEHGRLALDGMAGGQSGFVKISRLDEGTLNVSGDDLRWLVEEGGPQLLAALDRPNPNAQSQS